LAESSGDWDKWDDPLASDGPCPWGGLGNYQLVDERCDFNCPYRSACLSVQHQSRLRAPTKELEMIQMRAPWGRVRVWTIREVGKVTPVQEPFWADTYKQRRTESNLDGGGLRA